MNKKIYFILTLLFTGMMFLNAQQLAVSFSKTYNPALPLYGPKLMGRHVPITRNLTSTECLINTSTGKATLESAATSNGIFTAKILLTMSGQNVGRLTFSLQSGTDGDYNYVTHIILDELLTKTRRGGDWDGSAGQAMELVGMVVGSLDIFYDAPLVYVENPAAEKKRLADAAVEKQRQEAEAAQKREQEVAAQQQREEAQKTEITPEEEFVFKLTEDDKGVSITKYTGKRKYVSIPTEIQHFPVTTIGGETFENNNTIVSVTIADGVKKIGKETFRNCANLVSVTIPDSVAEIGEAVFREATSLTSIKLPTGLKEVPIEMFYKCTALKSITIPMSITVIKESAFYGSGLTSITIPESVSSIGEGAFRYTGLTSITFGKGLASIGEDAFSNCDELKTIVIPEWVTEIGVGAFSGCSALTTVTIPDSVESIQLGGTRDSSGTLLEGAFSGCGKLNLATQARLKKITITTAYEVEQAQKKREQEERNAQAKREQEERMAQVQRETEARSAQAERERAQIQRAQETAQALITRLMPIYGVASMRDKPNKQQFNEFIAIYPDYIASKNNYNSLGLRSGHPSHNDLDYIYRELDNYVRTIIEALDKGQKKTFDTKFK
jgi:hypothetical protein